MSGGHFDYEQYKLEQIADSNAALPEVGGHYLLQPLALGKLGWCIT